MKSTTFFFLATLVLPSFAAIQPTAIARVRRTHPKRQDSGGIGISLLSTDLIPAAQITVTSSPGVLVAGSGSSSSSSASSASSGGDSVTSASGGSSTSDAGSAVTTTTTSSGGKAKSTSTSTSTSSASSSTSSGSSSAASSLDLTVLNLALTLENLESLFYAKGLAKFDLNTMKAAGLSETQAQVIIEQVQIIQSDEATHASTLSSVITSLGGTPNTACGFNVDAVLTDPATFLAVGRTLEQVGVSAYLGAASLLSDKAILTAAGSILTIEARHQTLLNVFSAATSVSQAFDIALAPEQVLALAGGFLSGCNAADLGLTTNQPLSAVDQSTGSTKFQIGSQLKFSSTVDLSSSALSCQMIVGGAATALVFPADKCIVPSGINGPVAVYVTNSSEPLQSNLQTQDKTPILAGPALLFVDSQIDTLTSLFVIQGNNKSNSSSNSNNKNDRSLPSANMGMYNMQNSGKASKNNIIVQDTTITITQVVEEVIINDGSNSGKSSSKTSSSNKSKSTGKSKPTRRHHARRAARLGERDEMGVRVLGWTKLKRT